MDIKTDENNLLLKIPKDLIARDYVERFMDRIELEILVKKGRMSEEEAWELSERLKEDWWKENRDKVLKRIKMR
ncbi:MAG: hypothetical protein ACE5EA_11060 [Nitrospirota bacterium]